MKQKKFSLGSLFYDDKFVMLFSVLFSIVLWIFMATGNTEEFPRQITDVPVTIKLSDASGATTCMSDALIWFTIRLFPLMETVAV